MAGVEGVTRTLGAHRKHIRVCGQQGAPGSPEPLGGERQFPPGPDFQREAGLCRNPVPEEEA